MHESGSRLVDGLLDGARCAVEHLRDLGVAEAVELPQHERAALSFGQRLEVLVQVLQIGAQRDLFLDWSVAGLQGVELVDGPSAAQQRDRLVVGDPEQPRAQLDVPRLVLQRREGERHRALQRVLRVVIVVQDRAAVAIQGLVMAFVNRSEGSRVAGG
jgi:hypothetical protein